MTSPEKLKAWVKKQHEFRIYKEKLNREKAIFALRTKICEIYIHDRNIKKYYPLLKQLYKLIGE